MAVINKCKVCNKEFKTYPSKVKQGRGKYCSKSCCLKVTSVALFNRHTSTEFKCGKEHPFYKGYKWKKSKNGKVYKYMLNKKHPYCTKAGYVLEHRLVMEKHLGRYLTKNEIVHHIDSNALNNKIENLQLMAKKAHDRMNTKLNIHKRWNKNV